MFETLRLGPLSQPLRPGVRVKVGPGPAREEGSESGLRGGHAPFPLPTPLPRSSFRWLRLEMALSVGTLAEGHEGSCWVASLGGGAATLGPKGKWW